MKWGMVKGHSLNWSRGKRRSCAREPHVSQYSDNYLSRGWYRSKPCIASFLASVSLQLPGLATVTACCLVVVFFVFFRFCFCFCFCFCFISLFSYIFICRLLPLFVAFILHSFPFGLRFLFVWVNLSFFCFIILMHVVVFLCLDLLLFAISPLLT